MVAKTSGTSHIARVRKGTMEDVPTGKKGKTPIHHEADGGPAVVVDDDDLPLVDKRMHKKPKLMDSEVASDGKDLHPSPQAFAASDEPQQPFVTIAPATPGAAALKEMAAKRGKPDAPKFLIMLYEILQNESDKVIRWTDDGLALQILEQTNVTEKVLPKYFNHTNFHSFQRQLNYFGFRKWTKSKTDICTFSHPYFRRNQPELMHLIKRKKATRRANEPNQPEINTQALDAQQLAIAGALPKKLLPLSPLSKRRLAHEDLGHHQPPDSAQQSLPSTSYHSSNMMASLPGAPNGITLAPLSGSSTSSTATKSFTNATTLLTNAISPASGGVKKKAKTSSDTKTMYSTSPSNGSTTNPDMNELAAIAAMNPQAFSKGALPNLDIVRNRLIYRHPSQTTPPSSTNPQGFSNGFAFNTPTSQSQNIPTDSASLPPQSPAPSTDGNTTFSNSFSDPVDILLRIKKSRAMSQDNTQLQSPQQRANNQVEGIASLQNFLLTQSLYTNRLESQLKLALEENEALRQLVDSKSREVETLMNERKMIQNENAVLTEDKNKLFEINRDLLSKLFPQ